MFHWSVKERLRTSNISHISLSGIVLVVIISTCTCMVIKLYWKFLIIDVNESFGVLPEAMVLCNALTLNYEKSYTADVKTNRVTLDHSVLHVNLIGSSRHSAVFFWKSLNLILTGSLIVFYSFIKHVCMPVAL